MKHFENANNIDLIVNNITVDAEKMYLIVSRALNDFDDSIDDIYKLFIFEDLRTLTDIMLDYIVRLMKNGEALSNEYQKLWEAMRKAEKELDKGEDEPCQ